MKRLLLYLIILLLIGFNSHAMMPGFGEAMVGKPSAESPCTESVVFDKCQTGANAGSLGTNDYQLIKASGGTPTICKVLIETLYYELANPGDVHLEFWDTGDTTQYGDDSDSVTINSAVPASFEFTWSGTEPTLPNANVKMYIVEESGTISVDRNGDSACYEDNTYDLYLNGVDTNDDLPFTLYDR